MSAFKLTFRATRSTPSEPGTLKHVNEWFELAARGVRCAVRDQQAARVASWFSQLFSKSDH